MNLIQIHALTCGGMLSIEGPIKKPRKPYKTGSSDEDKEANDVSNSDDETLMLDDWDNFTMM